MNNLEWQGAAAAIGGIVGQFFKAQVGIDNRIPQVAMLVTGAVTYMAFNPPAGAAETGWGLVKYFIVAIVAGASVNGFASFVGTFVPALKTQEGPK